MSDAAEFRRNAQVCADLADHCKSPDERAEWLRMQQSWLTLAEGGRKPKPHDAADGSPTRP